MPNTISVGANHSILMKNKKGKTKQTQIKYTNGKATSNYIDDKTTMQHTHLRLKQATE